LDIRFIKITPSELFLNNIINKNGELSFDLKEDRRGEEILR